MHLRLNACMRREQLSGPPREIARTVSGLLSTFAFASDAKNVAALGHNLVV